MRTRTFLLAAGLLCGAAVIGSAEPSVNPSYSPTRVATLAALRSTILPLLLDVNCTTTPITCSGGGGGVTTSGNNEFTGSNTFQNDRTVFKNSAGDHTLALDYAASAFTLTTETITDFNIGTDNAGGGRLNFRTGGTSRWRVMEAGGNAGQLVPEANDTYDIGLAANAVRAIYLANGTAAAPAISFGGATRGGIFYASIGREIHFATNNTDLVTIGDSNGSLGLNIGSTSSNGMGLNFAATASGAPDLKLQREDIARLQLGQDVNGAAVAQKIKAHDGITGSNIAGASFTFSPGLGTGTGVSGPAIIERAIVKASGTTAQTYAPAVIVCPSKNLSTTSATAQTVATITTTSVSGGSVTMDYSTTACSATTCNTDGGMVKVGYRNAAGTVTSTITAVVLQSDTDATGTLATTPSRSDSTNVVSIVFTPTWVTIVPTSVVGYTKFHVFTAGDTVTCQ